MTIDLQRDPSTPTGTFGRMSVNGVFLCYSLEPYEDRSVYPAIPPGTYDLAITESQRFHRRLPILLNVPGRSGIRVHPGNFDDDTEWCILLGTSRHGDMLENSRAACDVFQSLIALPLARGEAVTLTVVDAPQETV